MKQFAFLFLGILFLNISYAQTNNLFKPLGIVRIITSNGNSMKGLLLSTNDTSLTVFPGKWKEWKKGKKYKPVEFCCSSIYSIQVKRKGRISRGIALGAAAGAIPLVTINPNEKGGYGMASLTVFTVPVGIVSGAIIGAKTGKQFMIKGDINLFRSFRESHL